MLLTHEFDAIALSQIGNVETPASSKDDDTGTATAMICSVIMC